MSLSNAEKQQRFRQRNVITVTHDAADIAGQLIDGRTPDEAAAVARKLRQVAGFVADHARHPERTLEQRMIAMGRAGVDSLNGPLPKLAAITAILKPQPETSWRIEPVTKDGQRCSASAA
jgi:hypothetical protein